MENQQFPLLNQFLNQRARHSVWEEKLRRWAKPPSDTETEKCEWAVRMVKEAIAEDPKLSKLDITVFGKGSFPNRTNIPSESDVDVGVRANELFINDYPSGTDKGDYGFVTATYTFEEFKKDVEAALVRKFGRREVTAGSKSIKVRSNSGRVDADVVPHFIHRRFSATLNMVEGVALRGDSRTVIYNWPQQDYDNAVAKNERTGKRYKAVVRILKNLRAEMEQEGVTAAAGIPSFLIACLVWNVEEYLLGDDSYLMTVLNSINYLCHALSDPQNVREWGEINELKYLFGPSQTWSIEKTLSFLLAARTYILEGT